MSLESRNRERARVARSEGRRRRARSRLPALLLVAFALTGPFLRTRMRAPEGAARIDRLRAPDDRRIDLNEAESGMLRALPGIGPRQAARILARRRLLGPFRREDDLSRLPGIGNNRFDRLRHLIRVERR